MKHKSRFWKDGKKKMATKCIHTAAKRRFHRICDNWPPQIDRVPTDRQLTITRVTIFFRQRTGTVVLLRDFSGGLKKKRSSLQRPTVFAWFSRSPKKKKVFTPVTPVFLRTVEWSSQTHKKTGHFHQPAGTPGHGLKIGTVRLNRDVW